MWLGLQSILSSSIVLLQSVLCDLKISDPLERHICSCNFFFFFLAGQKNQSWQDSFHKLQSDLEHNYFIWKFVQLPVGRIATSEVQQENKQVSPVTAFRSFCCGHNWHKCCRWLLRGLGVSSDVVLGGNVIDVRCLFYLVILVNAHSKMAKFAAFLLLSFP